MLETALSSLSGVPAILSYCVLASALLSMFTRMSPWITPHNELELIRANNAAAAIAFGGALVGFALPLSSAISNSLSLLDCAIWGLVALVVQVLTFLVLRMLLKQLPERIAQGETAVGIFAAASAIAVGMLNAACMTY